MKKTEVILVDNQDNPMGRMEKLEAHQKGLLHRAFSVFILNSKGEILLQKRASGKYHSPNLWTNACCSHPMPGEQTLQAAQRRLTEEMGFTCELKEIDAFVYKTEFDNGLIEHEFDHVLIGRYEGKISPNPDEVSEYRWVSISELNSLLSALEEEFTFWFLIAYPKVRKYLKA